jgi:hypothetical protein
MSNLKPVEEIGVVPYIDDAVFLRSHEGRKTLTHPQKVYGTERVKSVLFGGYRYDNDTENQLFNIAGRRIKKEQIVEADERHKADGMDRYSLLELTDGKKLMPTDTYMSLPTSILCGAKIEIERSLEHMGEESFFDRGGREARKEVEEDGLFKRVDGIKPWNEKQEEVRFDSKGFSDYNINGIKIGSISSSMGPFSSMPQSVLLAKLENGSNRPMMIFPHTETIIRNFAKKYDNEEIRNAARRIQDKGLITGQDYLIREVVGDIEVKKIYLSAERNSLGDEDFLIYSPDCFVELEKNNKENRLKLPTILGLGFWTMGKDDVPLSIRELKEESEKPYNVI